MHKFHWVVIACVWLAVSLAAQQRRAFEPGGPETMVQISTHTHQRAITKTEAEPTGFEFTMDASGHLKDAGPSGVKQKTKTVMEDFYPVTLYLDEQGAKDALKPLADQDLDSYAVQQKVEATILEAPFPKMLVVRFDAPAKAREVRENLSQELAKQMTGSSSEGGKFVGFFRKDFSAGDEVVIRIAEGKRILTRVNGKDQDVLQNPELAQALLKVWKSSDWTDGVKPLLQKK